MKRLLVLLALLPITTGCDMNDQADELRAKKDKHCPNDDGSDSGDDGEPEPEPVPPPAPHPKHHVISLPTGGHMVVKHGSLPGPTTLVVAGQHGREIGPLRALLGWNPSVWQGTLALAYPANPWGVMTENNTMDPAIAGPGINLNWGWGPWTGGGGDYPIALATWAVIVDELGEIDYLYDLHSSRSRSLWTTANYGHTILALEDEEHPQSYADAADLAVQLQSVEPEWAAWSPLHPIVGPHPLDVGTDPESVAWEFEGTLNKKVADEFPGAVSLTVEFAEDLAVGAPVVGLFPGESPPQVFSTTRRRRTVHERMLGMHIVLSHIYMRHASP